MRFSCTAISRAPLQQLAGITASSQTTQSKTSSMVRTGRGKGEKKMETIQVGTYERAFIIVWRDVVCPV